MAYNCSPSFNWRRHHQREVGTGVFDLVTRAVTAGQASTLALADSTEQHQF